MKLKNKIKVYLVKKMLKWIITQLYITNHSSKFSKKCGVVDFNEKSNGRFDEISIIVNKQKI